MSERMGIGRIDNTEPPIALSIMPTSIMLKFTAKPCAQALLYSHPGLQEQRSVCQEKGYMHC